MNFLGRRKTLASVKTDKSNLTRNPEDSALWACPKPSLHSDSMDFSVVVFLPLPFLIPIAWSKESWIRIPVLQQAICVILGTSYVTLRLYRMVFLAFSCWSLNTVLRVKREALGTMIKGIDSIDSIAKLPGFKIQLYQLCILEQVT